MFIELKFYNFLFKGSTSIAGLGPRFLAFLRKIKIYFLYQPVNSWKDIRLQWVGYTPHQSVMKKRINPVSPSIHSKAPIENPASSAKTNLLNLSCFFIEAKNRRCYVQLYIFRIITLVILGRNFSLRLNLCIWHNY